MNQTLNRTNIFYASSDSVENTNEIEKQKSIHPIALVESKYLSNMFDLSKSPKTIQVGDIIRLGYIILESGKERTQYYEGLIIALNNRGLGKTFTLRRMVQGIGLEQVFLLHSPKIVSLIRKQSSKVRRSKLYFIRFLKGKATRLKAKI